MKPAHRICLLLASVVFLAISVNGASTAGSQRDSDVSNGVIRALDNLRQLSRTKRAALGILGTLLGNSLLFSAKVLTFLNGLFDVPARTVINTVASWANYYNENQGRYGGSSSWFG